MNILLTGADGQVGRELAARLRHRANLLAANRAALDITDRNAVFQAASSFRPELIINAAAYTAVDKAESDANTAYAVNRDAVRHLAEAAAAHGAAVLHISTDYVFDGAADAASATASASLPTNTARPPLPPPSPTPSLPSPTPSTNPVLPTGASTTTPAAPTPAGTVLPNGFFRLPPHKASCPPCRSSKPSPPPTTPPPPAAPPIRGWTAAKSKTLSASNRPTGRRRWPI